MKHIEKIFIFLFAIVAIDINFLNSYDYLYFLIIGDNSMGVYHHIDNSFRLDNFIINIFTALAISFPFYFFGKKNTINKTIIKSNILLSIFILLAFLYHIVDSKSLIFSILFRGIIIIGIVDLIFIIINFIYSFNKKNKNGG